MEKLGATPGLRDKAKKTTTRNREVTMDFIIGFIVGMVVGAFIDAWRWVRNGR